MFRSFMLVDLYKEFRSAIITYLLDQRIRMRWAFS
jgi:hypothetical protein